MSQALAKTESAGTEVALNDELFDLISGDAGAGFQNMTVDDFIIPRIGIVQSLSPQRIASKQEFIAGCVEGQIFEGATKKLFDGAKGINVVPVMFNRAFLEWKPKDAGGGLAKNHGEDRTAYDAARLDPKTGARYTPAGNEIVLTAEYFVIVLRDNGVPMKAVISMSKSALKKAKAWNNLASEEKIFKGDKAFDTPLFYNVYNLKTVPVTNAQGSWFTWNVEKVKSVVEWAGDRSLYDSAKEFFTAITSGKVKAAEHTAAGDDAAAGASSAGDDEIPF